MASTSIDTLEAEYQALLEGCGLLDRSERGKLALSGAGALEFLNGQVTNELIALQPGEGCYAAFLTPKGKMLGDLRILAVGADDTQTAPSELLLDTERAALQALFDMIRRYKVGYQVELHKRTLERGLLSLIGPMPRPSPARGSRGSTSTSASTPAQPSRSTASPASPCAPTSAWTSSATPPTRASWPRRCRRAALRR